MMMIADSVPFLALAWHLLVIIGLPAEFVSGALQELAGPARACRPCKQRLY